MGMLGFSVPELRPPMSHMGYRGRENAGDVSDSGDPVVTPRHLSGPWPDVDHGENGAVVLRAHYRRQSPATERIEPMTPQISEGGRGVSGSQRNTCYRFGRCVTGCTPAEGLPGADGEMTLGFGDVSVADLAEICALGIEVPDQ